MISLRSLVLIAAICLLLYAIRRFRGRSSDKNRKPLRETRMVRCHYCGTYLPETEALRRNTKWYCCTAHCDGDEAG